MTSDPPPEFRPVRDVMAELHERTSELRRLRLEAEEARAQSSLPPVEQGVGSLAVGAVVQHTVYDPKTGRSRCGSCDRIVALGQETCICGARLIATLRSEA